MNWFNDLGIRTKLLSGFGVVLVLLGATAFMGIRQLNAAATRTANMHQQNVLGVHYVNQTMLWTVASGREQQGAILNAADPQKLADALKLGRDDMARAKDAATKYHETFANADDEKQWAVAEPQILTVLGAREAIFKQLEGGDLAGAKAAGAALAPKIAEMNKTVDAIVEANLGYSVTALKAANSATASARTLLIAIAIGAVIMGLGIGLYISRRITKDLATIQSRMTSIETNCLVFLENGIKGVESGDLTIDAQPVTPKVDNPGKDELGQMAAGINRMLDKLVSTIASYNGMRKGLSTIVGAVRDNANNILGASDQLRDASDQMASATGQISMAINEVTRSAVSLSELSQDSSREVERIAAASQQMAASANQNASSASQSQNLAADMGRRIDVVATASEGVAKSAQESRAAAVEGQQAVVQAVNSMESIAKAVQRAQETVNRLGEYGQQIGDIVKTIDEIASQTNLLALNAAIEAARAGEQGRGFAVVADNVRQLAERSSESTKEIADLITKVQAGTQQAVQAMDAGVKDVDAGRDITTQAGKALEAIIASVEQSAVQMQKIAGDVQTLSTGASQIVTAGEEIAQAASQSARGAEEMAQSTGRVTDSIIQVSATSQETSASAEEVSASTEELSAQSEELAATAAEMKKLAESLNRNTAQFKLAA